MLSPNELPSKPVGGYSLVTELLVGQLTLLALVVLGFGGATYWLVRQSVYREAEADLLGAAQLLAQELARAESIDSLAVDRSYRHRFGPAPRDHAYFAIWDEQGEQIGGSDPLPPHVVPFDRLPPAEGRRPFSTRAFGDDLEVAVRGPRNAQVLVGRPLAKEFDRLRRLWLSLCLVGGISLAAGGLAAAWLARRIIRPLSALTTTAEQVTARNLDQRLKLGSTSTELARLAKVFNTMLDRIAAAFQRQVRFTADASHELRTPVSVIMTQVEHTLARPRSAEEYATALATCLRAARRMKRLVDDLLLLARADAGRLETRREANDLAEIARAALQNLEPLANEQQVRVSSQLQATMVDCDAAQMEQVITNLVTNAIEYNHAGGEVFVTVHPEQRRAIMRVVDTGIGIAAPDQPRIFERFYRADQARTHREGQGTGLGLSIVAEIIAGEGGTIHVFSTTDQGTTVTVELPLREPATKRAASM